MENKGQTRIFDRPFSHRKPIFKSHFSHKCDAMVARYDNQDTIIAVGSSDGIVRLYNVNTNSGSDKYPTTALRWKPTHSDANVGSSSILATNASGRTIQFSTRSGKITYQNTEQDNYIFATDYSCDGKQFATTGKDCKIRIYDSETKDLMSSLAGVAWHKTGHNNRLFGLRFSPTNPNLMISGGWDHNVHIWDIRQGSVVGSIVGPKICGDAIDIKGNYILTGAHKIKDQLQLWDLGTQKLVHTFPWDNPQSSGLLFGVQFNKTNHNSFGAIGGNSLKLFNYVQPNYPQLMQIRSSNTLYALDTGNSNDRILIGGKGGNVDCFNITTI